MTTTTAIGSTARLARLLSNMERCPYCDHVLEFWPKSNTKSYTVDFEEQQVFIDVTCPNPECGATWTEGYSLHHVYFDREDERVSVRHALRQEGGAP